MAMIFHASRETETSIGFMKRSAEAGNPNAQYALGWAYLQGSGGSASAGKGREAIKWFKIASMNGHGEAGKALDVARQSLRQGEIDMALAADDDWVKARGSNVV
jgi:TPR repeat protein